MRELLLTANGSTPWLLSKADSLTMGVLGGTWGGGTLTLEVWRNGAAVAALDAAEDIEYTDDFMEPFKLGPGEKFRWTLASATSPSVRVAVPHELTAFNGD